MNALRRTGAVLLSLISISSSILAQQALLSTSTSASSLSGPGTIKLDVIVTDKSGKPVTGLQQQDFTVLDNKRPATVTSFTAHNSVTMPPTDVDASTELVILLDEVNTPYSRVVYARQNLETFLRQNQGKLTHPITLGIFADQGVQLQTQPSVDGNALADALEKMGQGFRPVDVGSAFAAGEIFDISQKGLQSLIDQLSKNHGKKMVIWLSPGWPLLSSERSQLTKKQEEEVYAMSIHLSNELRDARITFYSIDPSGSSFDVRRSGFYQNFTNPVTKSDGAQFGSLGLPVLVEQTGGRPIFGSGSLVSSLNHCVAELDAFYTLSIDAARGDRPNEFHALDIKLASPGLKSRTRDGYYAQP